LRKEEAVEVTREVVLPAPPDEVWEALTDPRQLEEWFANEVELELRPGGAGAFRWDDGETRLATVEEVEEGRRYAFRWSDEEGGDASSVELALEPVEEGTRVVVTETPITPEAYSGWSTALELRALAAVAAAR
jgi:uncharacterized protein YndB with AHSA1/START domain